MEITDMWKSIVGAVVLGLIAGSANAASFAISDWDQSTLNAPERLVNVGVDRFIVSTPSATGNPGSNMRVDTRLLGGSGSLVAFIGFDGLTYNPGAQGAVLGFDYSIDQIFEAGGTGGHGWGIAFKQGNNVDILDLFSRFRFTNTPTNRTTYTTFAETGLDTSVLRTLSGSGIDFSETGGLIQLGLGIFSGNGGASQRFDQTRYDNFSLTIQTAAVPVPAPLALLATGLIGLGVAARRKRQNG